MRRRNFLIKGGMATVAAMAGTDALTAMTRKLGGDDVIHIGIIGTGSRGSGLIPLLNQIAGVRVAACCDVLPFRLKDGMAKAGKGVKAYSDYRGLLDDKAIDAVLVATPFYTHASIAVDALDADKHVYCEKTMAKGIDGIQKVVAKTKTSKKIFQTGHQYHSSRLYKHIVALLQGGEVGEISLFECQWNRNGNWRRPVPKPELERAINWRMYREYSGGLAAELSSHQIDFVNWVLGTPPQEIMGVGGIDYWKDGRTTYDNIHLLATYPDGIKATFTCLTTNALGGYQIKIHGKKATLLLDSGKAWLYPEASYPKKKADVDGVSGATAKPWEQGKGIPIKYAHTNPSKQALIDFRDSIRSNTLPVSNVFTGAQTAITVQLALDAMYGQKTSHWKEK